MNYDPANDIGDYPADENLPSNTPISVYRQTEILKVSFFMTIGNKNPRPQVVEEVVTHLLAHLVLHHEKRDEPDILENQIKRIRKATQMYGELNALRPEFVYKDYQFPLVKEEKETPEQLKQQFDRLFKLFGDDIPYDMTPTGEAYERALCAVLGYYIASVIGTPGDEDFLDWFYDGDKDAEFDSEKYAKFVESITDIDAQMDRVKRNIRNVVEAMKQSTKKKQVQPVFESTYYY